MHFRSSNPPFFVFTFNPFGIKQALKCCNGTRSACRTKVTTFVYSTLVAAPCCPSKKSFLANASLAPSLSILHQQIGCCNRTTRKKGKSFWKSRKGFCLFHAIFDLALRKEWWCTVDGLESFLKDVDKKRAHTDFHPPWPGEGGESIHYKKLQSLLF